MRQADADADTVSPRDLAPMHRVLLDSQAADLPVPAPDWRRALAAAIVTDPRGRQGVAERLEVSRGYVSRVAGGDLTAAPPPRFIARVEATLMEVACPFLQRLLAPAQCRAFAARSYAQVSQFEVGHWRACRACPSNPTQPAAGAAQKTAPHAPLPASPPANQEAKL